jgi:hypothetical protein
LPLVDLETGSCRDGLHPDRRNENRGGESAVSYLLSVAEIRQLARTVGTDRSIHTLPLGRAGAPAEDNDSGTLGPARNEALWSAHGYPLKMSKGSILRTLRTPM